jgi:hypothetical protein
MAGGVRCGQEVGGALLYSGSWCHGWDGLASAWRLAQQSGVMHMSAETGRAHVCTQQGRSASAAWRVEAVPAAREGGTQHHALATCA